MFVAVHGTCTCVHMLLMRVFAAVQMLPLYFTVHVTIVCACNCTHVTMMRACNCTHATILRACNCTHVTIMRACYHHITARRITMYTARTEVRMHSFLDQLNAIELNNVTEAAVITFLVPISH